ETLARIERSSSTDDHSKKNHDPQYLVVDITVIDLDSPRLVNRFFDITLQREVVHTVFGYGALRRRF
ncbi:hypothetical protein ACI3PL_21710, partial [Lacticaseibacillus paracasei]